MDGFLVRAGRALYGPHWRSPLARDLGVDERSVRRWVAREAKPPGDLRHRLDDLIRERDDVLQALLGEIARWPE